MVRNKIKVSGIQVGPFPGNSERNWHKLELLLRKTVVKESPELVAFSELMTAPYFATVKEGKFFDMFSETMDGQTVQRCKELSLTYNIHIVGTLFERESIESMTNYYNTAFVCSPKRGLIGKYRKVHLPKVNSDSLTTDEKYYFESYGGGGNEFPVFTLDNGLRIGILICFDRSFPESWRALSIQGAELIIVPTAVYGFREELFVQELRVRAMENNVYVLAVNKSGAEEVEGESLTRHHFGHSCLINPYGDIISEIGGDDWSYLTGELDTLINQEARQRIDWIKERKTEVYKKYLFS